MNTHILWPTAAMAAGVLFVLQAAAQAPGEDPVILTGKQSIRMQPTNPAPTSGNIESRTGIPAAMQARITRYTAKAYSADAKGVITENDVVNTVTEGVGKTCVQEVGSSTVANQTPGTKYGPGQAAQVVVLRGDLVNICR